MTVEVSKCCDAEVQSLHAMDGVHSFCRNCKNKCETYRKSAKQREQVVPLGKGELDVVSPIKVHSKLISYCCGAQAYKTGKTTACAHCGKGCKAKKMLMPFAVVELDHMELIRILELMRIHFGAELPILAPKLNQAMAQIVELKNQISSYKSE